jgi:hypothetical protein
MPSGSRVSPVCDALRPVLIVAAFAFFFSGASGGAGSGTFAQSVLSIPTRTIAGPAPLTGLVLWSANRKIAEYSGAVALEFQYFRYDEVASGVPETGFTYDWTPVHRFLKEAAARRHHGIVRFRDTDPEFSNPSAFRAPFLGQPGVPASVRGVVRTALYDEGIPGALPTMVSFPDWSDARLVDFFAHFAAEFDRGSTALAYLQVGFGLWGEYHLDFDNMSGFSDESISTVGNALGKIFPSKPAQLRILAAINSSLRHTPWGISIDAADGEYSSFEGQPEKKDLSFGLFDDSFLSADPGGGKEESWAFFGKHAESPNGGEISYYAVKDQENALAVSGPHGVPLAAAAKRHSLTYLVGNDQTEYRTVSEIAAAGKSMGYRFAVRRASTTATETIVVIENTGTAAAFFDVYPAMGSIRSGMSLRGMLPGAANARTIRIPATGSASDFSLSSDRLLPGQAVPFQGSAPAPDSW